jgi:hypothetical protein
MINQQGAHSYIRRFKEVSHAETDYRSECPTDDLIALVTHGSALFLFHAVDGPQFQNHV